MSSLLLMSGGIDSSCLAALYRPAVCLTVDYGQRAAQAEIQSATQICRDLALKHVILTTNIGSLGSGQMAGQSCSPVSDHPEFWPFRNQFLVTLAGMLALKEECTQVMIGSVITDERHVDGSAVFRDLLSQLLRIQEGGITLVAPAAQMTTLELARASGITLDVLSWAHSCHTSNLACGRCPGCTKHSEVMRSLGLNR